ncbi:MAG: 2-oxoacid:acceptor oxidoreductase family protein [Desulfurococcales archaeon]|nr:2-oxoacid:acceptor oxidoreductase family protein [Desulfurococcales archaeon]
MIEIRFHGRGGQGAVTAANILVVAAYKAGLWGASFPHFGAERRGAPVTAFARISKRRVRVRSMIREPDVVVVLDPSLLKLVNVTQGLKPDGCVVINSPEKPDLQGRFRTCFVNASKIALSKGLVMAGWPLVNTAILGALAKALDFPIQHISEGVKEYLGGEAGVKNAEAAEEGFKEVRCVE